MQHDRERAAVHTGHEVRFGHLFVEPFRDRTQQLVATRRPVLRLQEVQVRDLEQEHGDRPLAPISRRQQALQMLEEAARPWQTRDRIVPFVVPSIALIGVSGKSHRSPIGAEGSDPEAALQSHQRNNRSSPKAIGLTWDNHRAWAGGFTVRARWPPTDARDGSCPQVPLDIRGQSFDSYRQNWTARRTGEAVSTKPMVSALWVPALVGSIRGAGWSEERIGRALGLRRDQLRLERRIPLDKYFALVDLVADVLDDPCFGLHFGAAHAFETAGVFNYIVQNSPNVGAAIANSVRYLRLIVDAADLSVELAGSRACLVYRMTDPSIVPSRHYTEMVIAYGLKGMRVIVHDAGWTPREIRFRHAPPTDLSPYERLFGATVRFGQDVDALVFDRTLLSQPIRTADLQLLQILEDARSGNPRGTPRQPTIWSAGSSNSWWAPCPTRAPASAQRRVRSV